MTILELKSTKIRDLYGPDYKGAFSCSLRCLLGCILLCLCVPMLMATEPSIETLRKTYPDNTYVIKKADVKVFIDMDGSTHIPRVRRIMQLEFLSLKNNTRVGNTFYHTNNSTLKKAKGAKFTLTSGDVNDDMIFHSDLQFASFSKVLKQAGELALLELTEEFKDFRFYTAETFAYPVPTLSKTVTIKVDSSIHLNTHLFNTEALELKQTHTKTAHETYRLEVLAMKNVPPLTKEEAATSIRSNYPHALIQVQHYTDRNGVQHPVFNTTDALYAFNKKYVAQTHNDTALLRPLLQTIVADSRDTVENVKRMYKWVQEKIRYIAFEYEMAGFIPESANAVVAKTYGDCKGVANLLKTFLTMQGLDARLCWINATGDPYDYSIPTIAIDNHMICAWMRNGTPVFLDATASNNSLEFPPEKLQGRQVLIENGESYVITHVPLLQIISNKAQYNFKMAVQSQRLSGNMEATFYGNRRAAMESFLKQTNATEKDVINHAIMNRSVELKWENQDNLTFEGDSVLAYASAVQFTGHCHRYGDEMFVKLCPMQNLELVQYDSARYCDVDLQLRDYIVYEVDLKIPDGYRVKSIPDSITVPSPVGSIAYAYTVTDENTVRYRRTYSCNKTVLKKEEIPDWNAFVQSAKGEDNKRLVFTKIKP